MKVLITGGAGYIGSMAVTKLLARGDQVTVLDDLWFGGDSLLPFLGNRNFRFIKADIVSKNSNLDEKIFIGIDSVIHLAAIVGFPACEEAGRDKVWDINVEGTKKIFTAAAQAGVSRLIFASSYSNYGESKQGELVTEDSPLYPKSIYAESKIEAEKFLLSQTDSQITAPVCLRLATVFGVSPRTRFDLIVNQFVLEAITRGNLTIYQENYKRSFVHVGDVIRAFLCMLDAPDLIVRGQVFNVGSEQLNKSKQEIVAIIKSYLPDLKVEYRETSFMEDMRSIQVSFEKIWRVLQFKPQTKLEMGIEELIWAIKNRIIWDPTSDKYRNHADLLL
jgi:nucleoside-diphosphate-sugar epimerase